MCNPPYNIKWDIPPFAQLQSRFSEFTLPPRSNANFAFILTGLDMIDNKAAFILPCSVLQSSNQKEEAEIRKELIENNVIEAAILLPDNMFESTNIGTCVLLFNKNKRTRKIEMIDLRKKYVEEKRAQNGQFGGAAHENRTYYKTVNIVTDETIKEVVEAVAEQKSVQEFCKSVSLEEIRERKYSLNPPAYIEFIERPDLHRPYSDIVADYNRIIKEKNALKLTVNESLAKSLGIYELYCSIKSGPDISDSFALVNEKAEKENFLTLSKNKAEFKIENKNDSQFPVILRLFLQQWKQHIMYLNEEENRILAEFRDAILPELMSGKIEVAENHHGRRSL